MTRRPSLAGLLAGEGKHSFALAVLILLYVVLMAGAQFRKFDSFGMGFDLGFYEQVIWNTSHGRWFATSTLKYTDTTLGHDVCLIEAIMALPYAVVPTTYTLLLLETLAIALGAIPLFWLARDKLGPGAALGVCFAYLGYCPLHFLNLYEFQPRAFALGPVFAMYYFLESQRLGEFLVSAILILTTRSDVALLVAMFGVYAFLRRKPRAFGASALAMGVSWFSVVVFVVVPHFNSTGRLQYLSWYEDLGRDPFEIATTLLTRPAFVAGKLFTQQKLMFLTQIYGPLGFLPLLRPDVLLLAGPTFVVTLLSSTSVTADIRYQYSEILYPIAFIGAVMAISTLTRFPPVNRRLEPRTVVRTLAGLLVVGAFLWQVLLPTPFWGWLVEAPPHSVLGARSLIKRIPSGASVAATNRLGSQLGRREGLFIFPPSRPFYSDQGLNKGDYVIADIKGDSGDPSLENLQSDPSWILISRTHRYALFQRATRTTGPPGLPGSPGKAPRKKQWVPRDSERDE